MYPAFDHAEFLMSSDNRVQALEALAQQPQSRSDLQSLTGVSRVTVGRMLADFEERGWVRRDDHEYEATILGEMMANDAIGLLETAATAETLRDLIEYLPTEEFDFDLDRLADATIVRTSPSDIDAPLRRMGEQIRDANELHVLAYATTIEGPRANVERMNGNHGPTEIVLSTGATETVQSDIEMSNYVQGLIEAGANIYRYSDQLPHDIVIADEIVMYYVFDERGNQLGLLETDDGVVRSWAMQTIERYKRTSEQLAAADFE